MEPGYDAWNAALIDLATAGVRRGSPIYLSIDDRALLVAWRHFLGQPAREGAAVRAAFAACLRQRCAHPFLPGFDLACLSGVGADGLPRCVGFLAAMVLAAYDMEDGDEAAELNYYYRLRRVFDPASVEHGQPPWLTDAYGGRLDEGLWCGWNRWLAENGWEPTAGHGGHNNRYINYPICQSILRNGDRERLVRLYRDHLEATQRSWDRELLAAHLPDLADKASSARLRALLANRDAADSRRFEAVAEAAFEVYAAMDWSSGEAAADSPNRIEAGLFRTEDRRGNATYALYPRLPLRWRTPAGLTVIDDATGETEPLTPDAHHAGKYRPLPWPLDSLGERRLRVLTGGADDGMELVLPGRDFWVLVQDPDDEYSDALATWGLPPLGEPFLLLCRPQHEPQLRALRELDLLSWKGDPIEPDVAGGPWREYHGCQVRRPRWDHVVPRRESRALVETLRPRPGRMTVSLEGGLSVPGQRVWLEGFPPKMRVRSDECSYSYSIRRRADGATVCEDASGQAHQLIDLPSLPPAEYEIEVRASGGVTARRVLRVAPWDTLEAAGATHCQAVEGDRLHFTLRGAHLLPGEP